MCGISVHLCSSANGVNSSRVLKDLFLLNKRGYDSYGIGVSVRNIIHQGHDSKPDSSQHYINNENKVFRKTGEITLNDKNETNVSSSVILGHTRWATTGKVSVENTHPQLSSDQTMMVVHNGIVENYRELKKDKLLGLERLNFKSETDTEVIANMFQECYNDDRDSELMLNRLEGTFAFVLLHSKFRERVYVYRKNSQSLLLGISNDSQHAIIASESIVFYDNNFESYFEVPNDVLFYVEIARDDESSFITCSIDLSRLRTFKVISSEIVYQPYPFRHWLMREIYEQPLTVVKATNMWTRIPEDDKIYLGGLSQCIHSISRAKRLIFLSIGSSLNASMFAESLCRRHIEARAFDASEFDVEEYIGENSRCYRDSVVFVFVSQSGETFDLCNVLRRLKVKRTESFLDFTFVGIVNEVNSHIAKEVDCGIYTNAGIENSVAATKTFVSQCVVLSLFVSYVLQVQTQGFEEHSADTYDFIRSVIEDVRSLPLDIDNTLKCVDHVKTEVSNAIPNCPVSCFIVGNYFSASEAALKMKEVAYIHAEALTLGALKHGPLSLIEQDTVVFILDNGEKRAKTLKDELMSRNAKVFVVGSGYDDGSSNCSGHVHVPKNTTFQGLLNVIPFQIVAYEHALKHDKNPDKPRNIAKCITVM